MKKLNFVMLSLALLLVCFGCERGFDDDDGERTEQNEGQGDDGDDEGNGGGENAGGGSEDDGDDSEGGISLGDEVSVSTFCNTPIYTQVWVCGYIVGDATGANGKVRYEFEPPFRYDTAILMADTPTADADTEVMSVCLTSCSNKIREELNLASHPENKGRWLRVFGFQDTYLKLPGIKHIDSHNFR